MKALNSDQLTIIQGGGSEFVSGLCTGITAGLGAAAVWSIVIPGSAAFWFGVTAVCIVNEII